MYCVGEMDPENMTLDKILEELNDLVEQGVKANEAARKKQKKTANTDLAAKIDRYNELGVEYLKKQDDELDNSMEDSAALKERRDAATAKHMENTSGSRANADGVRNDMDQLLREARKRKKKELKNRQRAVAAAKKKRDYAIAARRKGGGRYAAPLRF